MDDSSLEQYKVNDVEQANLKNLANNYLYFLPNNELAQFWINYCSGNLRPYSVIIRDETTVPFIVDISLKFSKEDILNNKSYLTNIVSNIYDFLDEVIRGCQTFIGHNFELSDNQIELTCLLIADNELIFNENKDKIVNFRAKIIFPYVILNHGRMKEIYIQYAYPYFNSVMNDYYSRLEISTIDADISSFPLSKEIVLFNSHPEHITMKNIVAYDVVQSDHVVYYDLESVFSVSDIPLVKNQTIIDGEDYAIDFFLPLILINGLSDIPITCKYLLKQKIGQNNTVKKKYVEENPNAQLISTIKDLLAMIKSRTIYKKCYWYDIAQSLYNLGYTHGCLDEMYSQLIRITSKAISDMKDSEMEQEVFEDDCEEHWKYFRLLTYNRAEKVENNTLNTLRWMAKKDSSTAYKTFHDKELDELLFAALSDPKRIVPIAKLFRSYYEFLFCYDPKGRTWYMYREHYWIQTCEIGINQKMEEFIVYLSKKLTYYAQNSIQKDGNKQLANQSYSNAISIIITLLNGPPKDTIIKELINHYACMDFNSMLNRNPNIFGVLNGVIDLRGGIPEFRDGKPEDYITYHGAYYDKNYTYDSKEVRKVSELLGKIHRDPGTRRFLLEITASCIKGGNDHRLIINLQGEGANAKSLSQFMAHAAFGDHFGELDGTYLSAPSKKAGEPDPAIIAVMDKRYVVSHENNPEDRLKEGQAKKISGKDKLVKRDLYQKGSDMKLLLPLFVVFMLTNSPLQLNLTSSNSATAERLVVIPFTSKWVTEDKLIDENGHIMSEEEQYQKGMFLMDVSKDKEVSLMGTGFLWLMVEAYKDYYKRGKLLYSQQIIAATNEYRLNGNMFYRFMRTCMSPALIATGEYDQTTGQPIFAADHQQYIKVDDAFVAFREWVFKEKIFGKDIDRPKFIFEFSSLLKYSPVTIEGIEVFTGIILLPGILSSRNEIAKKDGRNLMGLFN